MKIALTKCTRTAWKNSVLNVITKNNLFFSLPLTIILFGKISAYVRCGNESGQCIRVINRCNGVKDCVNGWDEDINTCFSEKIQTLFTFNSQHS